MILKDKISVITGAGSGIGADFSRALIEKGGIVYGIARRKENLDRLASELGDNFIPVTADVSKNNEIEQFVKTTFADQNGPDILINNAGVGASSPVDEFSVEEWDQMVGINLSGIFYLTRLIVPMMKAKENNTHIVNISSIAGLVSKADLSAYNATKAGVRGFSNALMKELRSYGIKVTCMYPGSIATGFLSQLHAETHTNMLHGKDVANLLINVLETPDNFLIDELVMRPLNSRPPEQ